jgi:hypothetical protein
MPTVQPARVPCSVGGRARLARSSIHASRMKAHRRRGRRRSSSPLFDISRRADAADVKMTLWHVLSRGAGSTTDDGRRTTASAGLALASDSRPSLQSLQTRPFRPLPCTTTSSSAGRSPLRFIEGQAAGVASLGRTPDVPLGSAGINGQRVSRPRPSSSARASYGREADRRPELCFGTSLVEVLTLEPATSASRPLALRLSGRHRTVSPRSRLATGVDR